MMATTAISPSRLVDACRKADIILICLLLHTSHALQPLDVGFFAPAKRIWKDVLRNFYTQSRQQALTNAAFASILKKLTDQVDPMWAIKGFSHSGLLPPDRTKPMRKSTSILQPQENEVSNDDTLILSPRRQDLRHLAGSILKVVAPEADMETRQAVENSKGRRRRVQAKPGEVLTSDEAVERLNVEEQRRLQKQRSKTTKGVQSALNSTTLPQNVAQPHCTTLLHNPVAQPRGSCGERGSRGGRGGRGSRGGRGGRGGNSRVINRRIDFGQAPCPVVNTDNSAATTTAISNPVKATFGKVTEAILEADPSDFDYRVFFEKEPEFDASTC